MFFFISLLKNHTEQEQVSTKNTLRRLGMREKKCSRLYDGMTGRGWSSCARVYASPFASMRTCGDFPPPLRLSPQPYQCYISSVIYGGGAIGKRGVAGRTVVPARLAGGCSGGGGTAAVCKLQTNVNNVGERHRPRQITFQLQPLPLLETR